MKHSGLVFSFIIAITWYSCNKCEGPDYGFNELRHNFTFVPITPGNRIPRSVFYPLFNRKDSVYQAYGAHYDRKWTPGIYLSSKTNTMEAIIHYEGEKDTVIFNYTSRIEFESNECEEEFELMAQNIQLVYASNDSIQYVNSRLILP